MTPDLRKALERAEYDLTFKQGKRDAAVKEYDRQELKVMRLRRRVKEMEAENG